MIEKGEGAQKGRRIDLNAASEEELANIEGIGPQRAHQIAEYRSQHGGFSDLEELKNVPGLTDDLSEKIRNRVSVAGERQSEEGTEPSSSSDKQSSRVTESDEED